MATTQTSVVMEEETRSGFLTAKEPHPTKLVEGGNINSDISIKTLRAAVPAHCFTPSHFWSFFYLFRDLSYTALLLTALYYALQVPVVASSPLLTYSTLFAYSFAQGLVWTGLWIIAHDGGHSAFSTYSWLNDLVGWTLHSLLLVPYFSWKSTHRRHHIYANHITKDLAYVPPVRSEYAKKVGVALERLEEIGEDAPIVVLVRIIMQQAAGWLLYIWTNVTCRPDSVHKRNMGWWRHSHFDPWGALFRDAEVGAVLLSDLGCALTMGLLYGLKVWTGMSAGMLFWVYFAPWAWVHHWIVMITYLHHTHPSVPKYTPESWTFLRGATATMDRDFGFIGTHFFHHISSDHVTHHIFSRIPHYRQREASNAIIPLLGRHYHGRGTFTYGDLKTAFVDCQWVEGDKSKDERFGLSGRDQTASDKSAGDEKQDAGKSIATDSTVDNDNEDEKQSSKNEALWWHKGVSQVRERRVRGFMNSWTWSWQESRD